MTKEIDANDRLLLLEKKLENLERQVKLNRKQIYEDKVNYNLDRSDRDRIIKELQKKEID